MHSRLSLVGYSLETPHIPAWTFMMAGALQTARMCVCMHGSACGVHHTSARRSAPLQGACLLLTDGNACCPPPPRRVAVFPRGNALNPGYVSAFLEVLGLGTDPLDTYPSTSFKLFLINQQDLARSILKGVWAPQTLPDLMTAIIRWASCSVARLHKDLTQACTMFCRRSSTPAIIKGRGHVVCMYRSHYFHLLHCRDDP